MIDPPDHAPGEAKLVKLANDRNGTIRGRLITDDGPVCIEVPCDRDGRFERQIIPEHARRFIGSDEKIIAMNARGTTVREIQGSLPEIHDTDVFPEFIRQVTDEVTAEISPSQSRQIEATYQVIYFDALRERILSNKVPLAKECKAAMNQFTAMHGERFTGATV
jgi:transposase-like protein